MTAVEFLALVLLLMTLTKYNSLTREEKSEANDLELPPGDARRRNLSTRISSSKV